MGMGIAMQENNQQDNLDKMKNKNSPRIDDLGSDKGTLLLKLNKVKEEQKKETDNNICLHGLHSNQIYKRNGEEGIICLSSDNPALIYSNNRIAKLASEREELEKALGLKKEEGYGKDDLFKVLEQTDVEESDFGNK
jgi:hypothetical protein